MTIPKFPIGNIEHWKICSRTRFSKFNTNMNAGGFEPVLGKTHSTLFSNVEGGAKFCIRGNQMTWNTLVKIGTVQLAFEQSFWWEFWFILKGEKNIMVVYAVVGVVMIGWLRKGSRCCPKQLKHSHNDFGVLYKPCWKFTSLEQDPSPFCSLNNPYPSKHACIWGLKAK